MNNTPGKKNLFENRIFKGIIVLLWLLTVVIIFLNRDIFTPDELVYRSPQDTVSAIAVLMLLFALKSVSVVIYCGVLFIASGILFPLYIALPVSFVGAFIMISLPYLLGRYLGSDSVDYLLEKYPKLQKVREERSKDDLMFAFLIQATGFIPSDPFSAYMGAVGANYKKYAVGSMLGYMFDLVPYTVMGISVTDPGSPAFIGALSLRIVTAVAATVYTFSRRRRNSGQDKS